MHDHENSPEAELIRRAIQGDVKAFSQLYAGIYMDLYRFALCATRHSQDAEDAVSEAVVAAYENIAQLRKEESFRAWMFTILNNSCRKILRKQRRDTVRLTDSAELENLPEHSGASGGAGRPLYGCAGRKTVGHARGYVQDHAQDYAEKQVVRDAFAALDEEERMIIAFSVFGGYRSEEIGMIMEKNAATVRSRKSRALEKMRRMLTGASMERREYDDRE